ncbi:unnamed protein product [Caenorhabditis angaria]|uniref:Uncharacterized protein n=1 Tax=Caenorhabditis angaria TaxID=860376 RepID=A0A9P1IZI9_9PELO|nr:unnamed protein product [Caenorhabditis angaria]
MDSPSSSSSCVSSTSLSPIHQNCQICFQAAHGKHFGAYSCRACSAFFRRAVIGNYEKIKCRQGDGKCEARLDGRFSCKKCRLEKCFSAGMREEKLQFDRDLVSSTEQFVRKRKILFSTIPHSPECFLGRPSFIFACEPDIATSSRTLIDVQLLIEKASNLFISNNSSRQSEILTGMSTLDRLSYALDLSHEPTNEDPVIVNKIGKDETLLFWEYKFLNAANWLTYSDEFQQLPQKMKVEFVKSIWFVWMKMDKIAGAAERRMKQKEKEDESLCHVTKNVYIDIDKVELDTSWMSNYKKEQLAYFIEKPSRSYQNNIVEPLMELRPTIQEVTYMVCVVSFRYAAKQHGGDIADISEKLIEKLANDLHNYYFNEMNLRNYASRMAKMMRIVQFVERDIQDRKQRAEIARLFDVFTIEFSHPEMFIGF